MCRRSCCCSYESPCCHQHLRHVFFFLSPSSSVCFSFLEQRQFPSTPLIFLKLSFSLFSRARILLLFFHVCFSHCIALELDICIYVCLSRSLLLLLLLSASIATRAPEMEASSKSGKKRLLQNPVRRDLFKIR